MKTSRISWLKSLLSNVWPYQTSALGQWELQQHQKSVLSSHISLCAQPPPRGKLFLESQKGTKKKCSQGQQNFQAIGIKAAGSHTIRAFSVTHQCVINMHSKAHVTLCECRRLWSLFQTDRFLSLSCNWLHFWNSKAFTIPTHTHTLTPLGSLNANEFSF